MSNMGIDMGRFKKDKGEEWVDWLADDPVPASIRQKMRTKSVHDASRPVRVHDSLSSSTLPSIKTVNNASKTVSINISVPRITAKRPHFTVPPTIKDHKWWILGGTMCLIALSGIGFTVLQSKDATVPGDTAVLSQTDTKASFDYSLPDGNESEVDGQVRFDPEKQVVNFVDSIGGIDITISQQPLPEDFKDDTDAKVKKLAEGFSATKTIATANPTAYIGTSAKGPQTVIFAKNDLLVFMQSSKKIDDVDWASYVTNLK